MDEFDPGKLGAVAVEDSGPSSWGAVAVESKPPESSDDRLLRTFPASPRALSARALSKGLEKPFTQRLAETEQAAFHPVIPLPRVGKETSNKYPYTSALVNEILSIGEAIESPGGLMLGGAGGALGKTGAKAVGEAFALRMAAGAAAGATEAGTKSGSGEPSERAAGNVGFGASLALPGLPYVVPLMKGKEPPPEWSPEQAQADLVARNVAAPGTLRPQETRAMEPPAPESPPMEVKPGEGAPPWQKPELQIFGPVKFEELGAVPVEGKLPTSGREFVSVADKTGALRTAEERIISKPTVGIGHEPLMPVEAPEMTQPLTTTENLVADRLRKRDFSSAVTELGKQPAVIQRKVLDDLLGVNREKVGLSAAEETLFREIWDKAVGVPPELVKTAPETAKALEATLQAKPVEIPVPPPTEVPAPEIAKTTAPESPKPLTPDQEYDASLETFRAASKAFTKARDDYRAKKIGDAEFLAAKAEFNKAQEVSDAAETKFIEAKNKAAETPTKEPWQMTKDEWLAYTAKKLAPDNAELKAKGFSGEVTPNMNAHYWTVKHAVESGKTVPPEVLADYPEFKGPEAATVSAAESELSDAENFTGKAAVESEKATVAWAKHVEDVVNPLKAKIRKIESEVNQMAGDARRTKPEVKGKKHLTKKAFLEQYGVASMDEANELYKQKNQEWASLEKQLEDAETKRKELEIAKERRSKEWSSAATRSGELRRQVYPKVREGDAAMPSPAAGQSKGIVSGTKAEAWADQVIKNKSAGTSALPFLDPEFAAAVTIKGAAIFERGVRDFAEWSKEMMKVYGPIVEMRLQDIYAAAVKYHEDAAANQPSKEVATAPPQVRPNGQLSPSSARFLIDRQYFTADPTSKGPWAPYLDALQNRSFPNMTAANSALGESATRMIAAHDYGYLRGLIFVHDALEGTGVDPRKFWIAMHEDNLQDLRQRHVSNAEFLKDQGNFGDAVKEAKKADEVTSWLGKEGSPFATEREWRQYLDTPEVQLALAKWKQLWAEQKDPMFREANDLDPDVELPGRGLNTGARVNMTFRYPGEAEVVPSGASGQQLKQLGTLKRKDPLSKKAKGTGKSYIDNPHEAMARAFGREYPVAAQHDFINKMVETGNAVISKKSFDADLGEKGYSTQGYPLTLRKWQGQWIHPKENLVREYKSAVGLYEDRHIPVFSSLASVFTKSSIVGLSEGTTHASNLMMGLLTSSGPTASPVFNSILKAGFRADTIPSIAKVLAYGNAEHVPGVVAGIMQKVGLGVPKELAGMSTEGMTMAEYVNRMSAALTRIGATKGAYRGFISSRLLNPIDRGVRVILAEQWLKMADAGLVERSETNLREFVNQSGNYWSKAQNQLVRDLKTTGVQPFATALWNYSILGIKKGVLLSPGVKATTTRAALALRAEQIAGLVGVFTASAALNWMINGNKPTPPEVPVGALWGERDDGSHWYINTARLYGYERGWRVTGITPFIESKRRGLTSKEAVESAAQSISNLPASLFAGPATRFFFEAATGKSMGFPAFQQAAVSAPTEPWYQQRLNNVFAAIQDANGIIGTAADVVQGKPLQEALRRQLPRYVPRSAMSPEMVEKLPTIVQKGEVNAFVKDTIRRARQLKPENREQFIDAQAEKLDDWRERKRLKSIARKAMNEN